MKLRKGGPARIEYLLDVGNEKFSKTSVPASVALEVVSRAKTRKLGGTQGFELVVDGDMLFPLDAFDWDESEKAELIGGPVKQQKHGSK